MGGLEDVAAVVEERFGLFEEGVAGEGLGGGVGGFVEVVAGVLGRGPAQAVIDHFGEEPGTGGQLFDGVAGFVVPGVVGEGVADGSGRGIDGVPLGAVSASPLVVEGFRTADEIAAVGGVVAFGFGGAAQVVVRIDLVEIDLAVGVGAAVSPVVSEGGDARVGCRDVLGLLGQVAIVAVVPRVVLVGGHFDHVVAGGRGSRRIGVGGGGVVGADPGFENKTAGVEDLPSDGAAGRDGFDTAVTAEKPKVSQRQQ